MDENNKVDVRIIISETNLTEIISKAISKLNLDEDYNIIVSSIIPTDNFEIACKAAKGGDIIMIGSYGHDENFNLLYDALKTDFNHIILLDYNNLMENDLFKLDLVEKEIFNGIIKAGLAYSLNIINFHSIENKFNNLESQYNEILKEYEKTVKENEMISEENLRILANYDDLKEEFSLFKDKYEDISTKNILEIFSLEDLWNDLFSDISVPYEKIILATDKFKPDNIIIGQGFIAAENKELAADWLKIVKTALIFTEDNEDLSSNDEDLEDNVSEIDNDDYDIPNSFSNFWD